MIFATNLNTSFSMDAFAPPKIPKCNPEAQTPILELRYGVCKLCSPSLAQNTKRGSLGLTLHPPFVPTKRTHEPRTPGNKPPQNDRVPQRLIIRQDGLGMHDTCKDASDTIAVVQRLFSYVSIHRYVYPRSSPIIPFRKSEVRGPRSWFIA